MANGNYWPWQDGQTQVSIARPAGREQLSNEAIADPEWTLIKVQLPPNPLQDVGVDGQFTLQYTYNVLDSRVEEHPPVQSQNRKKEAEDRFEFSALAARIADPMTKAKFMADVQAVLRQFTPQPEVKRSSRQIDPEIKIEPPTKQDVNHTKSALGQVAKDAPKKRLNDALRMLVDKYGNQIPPSTTNKK